MKKIDKLLRVIIALLIVLAVVLVGFTLGYKRDSPSLNDVQTLDHMEMSINGGAWREVELPVQLHDIPANSVVSLRSVVVGNEQAGILFQANYVAANIYFDGDLVFEMGKLSNYPSFMKTPGKEAHIVEFKEAGKPVEVQIDYMVSVEEDLIIHAPSVGTAKELLMLRAQQYGNLMILSIGQIIGGCALAVVGLCIAAIDKKGYLYMQLGLFITLSGIWLFGNNDATIVLVPFTALLYMSSFIALLLFPIPLFEFVKLSIPFSKPRVVDLLELVFIGIAGVFALIQISGLYPLHRIMFIYFIAFFISMILLNACVIHEYHESKNIDARNFILPVFVMTISSLVGYISYLLPLWRSIQVVQQFGFVLSFLIVGVIVGLNVKDSLNVQQQLSAASYEKELLSMREQEYQIASRRFVHDENRLREQRDNFQQKLAVIESYADDKDKLLQYLGTLKVQIPKATNLYCQNTSVNAIISHFVEIGKHYNIEFEIKTIVPQTDQITESKLSVVFANLLENAIEACKHMESDERFIRLASSMQYEFLTIVLDNSFDGAVSRNDKGLVSSKRNHRAKGIPSIMMIVDEYRGDAEFSSEDHVFHSSVYLTLKK